MSFIEKLRQEAESEEKQRAEALAAERAFHKQRKDQSLDIRKESGVGALVEQLAEALKTGNRLVGYYPNTAFSREWNRGIEYDALQISTMDTDSVFDKLAFDSSRDQELIDGGVYSTIYYDDRYYDVQRHKGILVETRPNGNIVFHGAKQLVISNPQWEVSQDVLEGALEVAFNNPYYYESRHFRRAEPGHWPEI